MTVNEQIRNLTKLIWTIVLKHGGEIRLSEIEQSILHDNWELLEYTDIRTLERVLKARIAPNRDTVLQRADDTQLEISDALDNISAKGITTA